MKDMSFVSLMNILISSVDEGEHKATEEDVRRMFGWFQKKYTMCGSAEEKRMRE